MNWRRILGVLFIGVGLAVLTLKLTRVYDPVPGIDRASAKYFGKAKSGVGKTLGRVPAGRVVYATMVIVPWFVGVILLFGGASNTRGQPIGKTSPAAQSSRITPKP